MKHLTPAPAATPAEQAEERLVKEWLAAMRQEYDALPCNICGLDVVLAGPVSVRGHTVTGVPLIEHPECLEALASGGMVAP